MVADRKFDTIALSSAEVVTVYAEGHAVMYVNDVADLPSRRAIPVEGDTRRGVPHDIVLEYADLRLLGTRGVRRVAITFVWQ